MRTLLVAGLLAITGLACSQAEPTTAPASMPEPSSVASPTPIPTATPSPTVTPAPVPTVTQSPTPVTETMPTSAPTPTLTPISEHTPTPTSEVTPTPVLKPTPTPTSRPTPNPTQTPRPTRTPTPTPTPIPPRITVAAQLKPSLVGVTGESSAGLGFFVDIRDGSPSSDYILTKRSIISDDCRVTLQLPPTQFETLGSSIWGQVYARDDILDLALIEIPARGSESVEWGDLGEVAVGDAVFAIEIGESDRQPYNVVEGIVRNADAPAPHTMENAPGARFVSVDFDGATDSQGGPLVNLDGRVLGINFTIVDAEGKPTTQKTNLSLAPERLLQEIRRLNQGATIFTTTPSSPIAGRPVTFAIEKQPYQKVEVTLLDPTGQKVAWIYPEDTIKYKDGQPITSRTFAADACGKIEWMRRGFRDSPGEWTVEYTVDPDTPNARTDTLRYVLNELGSEPPERVYMWTDLNRYQGTGSDVYYSELVPAALAADIQSQLVHTADFLQERLGVRPDEIQDVYLMGNRTLFEQVERYMGIDAGFEIGFYAIPCHQCLQARPGLYIQTDAHDSENGLHLTLAHEYAHSLVDYVSNQKGEVLPTWVNEGFAVWSEYEVGLSSQRPASTYQSMFYRADLVRSAALTGDLFTLPSLESRLSWGNRAGDEVSLQYGQAYMAMRYLIETYGASSAVSMIADLGIRGTLQIVLEAATGVTYRDFERGFNEWLKDEEPTSSYYQKGREYYDAGEYEEAVNQFSIVVGINPGRAIAFRYRGRAYDKLDEQHTAIEDYDESIRLEPSNQTGFNLRGIARYNLQEYQEAVKDFDQAIRLNPSAVLYTNRGSSYYRLHQYQLAIQDFNHAITIDLSYAPAYNARASTYKKLGKFEEEQSSRAEACSLASRYC